LDAAPIAELLSDRISRFMADAPSESDR
jgi:hypothetical protein